MALSGTSMEIRFIVENKSIFRYLIKIAGKALFIIGLAHNILMIFFGFWPSLIYLFAMVTGVGMYNHYSSHFIDL